MASTLPVGHEQDGYRYVGGDVSNQQSWEPIGLNIGTVQDGFQFNGGNPNQKANWSAYTEPGDVSRGAQVALGQTMPIVKGVVGLLGATAEKAFGEGGISTAIKNYGLEGYTHGMQKLAPLQHENDNLTSAWDKAKNGDPGALVDWAQYGIGYAIGQGGEALATSLLGGITGAALAPEVAPVSGAAGAITGLVAKGAVKDVAKSMIEKAVLKEANKLMAESSVGLTAQAATKQATKNIASSIGSSTALGTYGIGQELGSIYPEAEAQAASEGRKLSGGDLARVWGSGIAAGGLEAITDKLGIDLAMGKSKFFGKGMLGKGAVGATAGILGEGATEGIQTEIERFGAGQSLTDEAAKQDVINSAGLGAIGGGGIGGTAGLIQGAFASKQRAQEDLAIKNATDAGSAAAAADQLSGNMDEILHQTVNADLIPAMNADLGTRIPSPKEVLAAEAASPLLANVPLPGPQTMEQKRQAIDRQAGLTAEANAAPTEFDRQNALDQAKVPATTNESPANGFVDLTPMNPQQAQSRLAVMRDMAANAGENALNLVIKQHPAISGKLAIGTRELSSLDLTANPGATPEAVQHRIETAALTGKVENFKAEDRNSRQVVIDRALRNVEGRNGVASPMEALIFHEAGLGKPYDRVDINLAPALTTDETLTQATTIPLVKTPRESGTETQRVASVQAANNESMANREQRNAANKEQAARNLDNQIAAATPMSAEDKALLARAKNAPYLLSLEDKNRIAELNNAPVKETPATVAPLNTDLMGTRTASALGLENPTPNTIVQTDAKLSTIREGGVTTLQSNSITDNGVKHEFTVVPSGQRAGLSSLIKQLARRFGKNVVFFNSDTLKADGFVRKADNQTIYINAKSTMSPLAVFGHELLHLLKNDNPVAYAAIAKVIASKLDTESRAKFRADYGSGASLEELSADLLGNAFQDSQFLTDVFTEIANSAPEGEARGIIMRLAAAINKAIAAALDVIRTMPEGSQKFKADDLVKNLTDVRAALKTAMVQYAADQKIPAMAMEHEQMKAAARTDLTAHSNVAPPEEVLLSSQKTPEAIAARASAKAAAAQVKAQNKLNTVVERSNANEQRRGVAVLASAKPGNELATVTGRRGKDLPRLHQRVNLILNAAPAKELYKSLGISSISFPTYSGSWKGEQELSFFITAKDTDGNALSYEKTRSLGGLLAWAFQQDAAITSQAVETVPDDAQDIIPSLYFGRGDGLALSQKDVNAAFKAFNAIGEDASVTPDGKSFKFLYFGEGDKIVAYKDNLKIVADKLGFTGVTIAYNRGNLDDFKKVDENGNDKRSYRQILSGTGDTLSTAGASGILDRATDSLLVPYILAVRAEGFGFDYARWQSVNDATKEQRQQLESKVNAAEAANKHGLVPRLREKIDIAKLKDVPLTPVITQKTTSGNAQEQLDALDGLLSRFPDVLKSALDYLKFQAHAFGSNDQPLAPRNIINFLQNNGLGILNQLKRLTQGQIADANAGFANGQKFRNLYTSKQVPIETTGKLMLWSFLSRGVSPYVQEAMFVDAVRGIEPFVKASAEGNFGPDMKAKYITWANGIAASNGKNMPGNGTTHNLNAFGKTFLLRMSEKMPDGRTKLQTLHDMFSDPDMTGPQIRREFVKMGEGVGIDNKVLSFTLLVIGHTDVVVLDRVQMKNIYDDGSFANYNLYDGTYRTLIREKTNVNEDSAQTTDEYGNPIDEDAAHVKFFEALEQNENESKAEYGVRVTEAIARVSAKEGIPVEELVGKRMIKPGSGLASMTTGVRGLILYETIENELDRVLPRVYKGLGRPQDASPGRWHWESWVVSSGQEASHGTLDALLAEAEKKINPFADVPVKQGEYGMTDYGVRYARDKKNKQYFTYDDSKGQAYRFTPGSWRETLAAIKKTFPAKFLISMNADRTDRTQPWFFDPRIDRNKIDTVIHEIGVIDKTAAKKSDITKSSQRIVGDSNRAYTPEQKKMFSAVGRTVDVPTMKERLLEMKKDWNKKLAQGMADQFAPLKDLSLKAYQLARLSKGAVGAFEALLKHGKLSLKDGAYDADMSGGFIDRVGVPLSGELEDFLWWVAGNRAEQLSKEDREHLFTPESIAAAKSLANGKTKFTYTIQNGPSKGTTTQDRTTIYKDSAVTFDSFNKNTLDMAEQSGLIDKESRGLWEKQFYVPFYRQTDESSAAKGGQIKQGLVRQEAFKRLKGGSNKLNSDLLANTLSNWGHLIDASGKNRAAVESMAAAVKMNFAIETTERAARQMAKSMGKNSTVVSTMDQGTERFYVVEDPALLTAITSLEYSGMRGQIMDALSTFKHVLTVGVTAAPPFKIRNLIRDSLQSIATADLSYNVAGNLVQGFKASSRDSQTYVSMLAGGGLIRFGTMLEGSESRRTVKLIKMGVKDTSILDSEPKYQQLYDKFIEPAISAYNELGNRGEEINRAALYEQLVGKVGHAEASFLARDLMDFSLQGSWATVRFFTQVVPFMNARIQGLYKLGKAAHEDPARFALVLGTIALASVALMAHYSDDPDWKKREDWDRNNYWWFKIGGEAFRIPKPFEIGAMATLAERGLEWFTNPEMTTPRLTQNVYTIFRDNLSFTLIPQAAKPLLDIYANKDSFTGRPIETMGMERLQSQYRFTSSTSMTARGLATAQAAITPDALKGTVLSPVQYDSLIRGYFSWLGSMSVLAADVVVRSATGQPTRPSMDYVKMATGGMVSDVNSGQSRYVSQMYDQASVIEQAYGTWNMLRKTNQPEAAKEFYNENKDKLMKYQQIEHVKSAETKFNERIRFIERSPMSADVKREKINQINVQKERAAQLVAPGYKR